MIHFDFSYPELLFRVSCVDKVVVSLPEVCGPHVSGLGWDYLEEFISSGRTWLGPECGGRVSLRGRQVYLRVFALAMFQINYPGLSCSIIFPGALSLFATVLNQSSKATLYRVSVPDLGVYLEPNHLWVYPGG